MMDGFERVVQFYITLAVLAGVFIGWLVFA